jgi:hypothetical protein
VGDGRSNFSSAYGANQRLASGISFCLHFLLAPLVNRFCLKNQPFCCAKRGKTWSFCTQMQYGNVRPEEDHAIWPKPAGVETPTPMRSCSFSGFPSGALPETPVLANLLTEPQRKSNTARWTGDLRPLGRGGEIT